MKGIRFTGQIELGVTYRENRACGGGGERYGVKGRTELEENEDSEEARIFIRAVSVLYKGQKRTKKV